MIIPPDIRQATTLEQLAAIYDRPLSEFQRLNEGGMPLSSVWEGDAPAGLVRVPDDTFAPYLAARFAAEALVDKTITDARDRVLLLQRLVPVAIIKPTALDTVLMRLLLAAFPLLRDDEKTLAELAKVAPMSAPGSSQ